MLQHNVASAEGLRKCFDYIVGEAKERLDREDSYMVVKADVNIYTRLVKVILFFSHDFGIFFF